MRPVSLTITSFGPFRETQRISFESLAEIFLITGKTGSGKTTVFDALMFALYGKLPGTRDPKSIVSDYMDENAAPSVELVFTTGGRRFKIIRQPQFARKTAGGRELKTPSPPTAALYRMEGSSWKPVPGKLTEINDCIEEMLRLTADEFSKIVLLPQGEFQKFLVADTKDKTRLLEKLFPTSRHEEIGRIIKARYLDRKKEADMTAAARESLAAEFDPAAYDAALSDLTEGLSATETLLSRARQDMSSATEALASARETESDFIELDRNAAALKQMAEKSGEIAEAGRRASAAREALEIMPVINARAEVMDEIVSVKGKISAAEKFIESEKAALALVAGKEAAIPGLESEIAKLTEETGRINSLLPRAKTLSDKKTELKKLEESCSQAADKINVLKKKLEKTVSAKNTLRAEIDQAEKKLLPYEEIVRELADVSMRCADISAASAKNAEAEKAAQVISRSRTEMREHEERLALLKEEEAGLARRRDASTAAGLAHMLKKGEPCPVCGSTEHPLPARGESFSPDESGRLASLSSVISAAEKAIAGLAERAANHSAILAALRAEITALSGDGETLAGISEKKKSLEEKIKSLETMRAGLAAEKKRYAGIEDEAASLSADIEKSSSDMRSALVARDTLRNEIDSLSRECGDPEKLSASVERHKKEIAAKKEKIDGIIKEKKDKELGIEGASRRLDSLRESLESLELKKSGLDGQISAEAAARGFASPDEARNACLEKSAILTLEKTVREFQEEKKSAEKALEFLMKKTAGKQRPDTASIEKRHAELSKSAAEIEKKAGDERIRIHELKSRKERYDSLTGTIDRLLRETESLAALSNDLNGRNPKNLTFQNFVLGAYLEEVARHASARLHSMSEERYTLVLNEEISHGNREAGLDLDVIDSFTGQKRSVKSLSGGEKFMASIALALGLADVIQSRSGGVELDAIFIDEGFGSLDDSALDRALGILDDIRGDRMVGIISHVGELKNRIPSIIHVIKGAGGSRIVTE
ncbi:MAG TPA: AAA family ATPase [Spirochaetota bacterium]|nr:AAA family ATPase [Spirochaetota bacterium]HRZ26209.1 AAA family ATPase [Spirochaetota bacterium]